MARITIPQRNRAGLSKILALPSELFEEFRAALASQRPKLDLTITALDAIKLSRISKNDLEEMLSALTSLSVVRWSRDAPVETFVKDIAEAIEAFDSAGGTEESKHRLLTLLSIESILIASKAIAIFTDYQRTLHGSKVLSDLRYVFRSNPDEEPYGAVIVHLLKLSYHEDTEHKEFFVAMDDNDLQRLKEIVERAEAKARTIRRKLNAAKTEYLGAEPLKKGHS